MAFTDEDHVRDFIDAAKEIIPKIKYTNINGEGYTCIIYTRKDKNYRCLMNTASAPATIVEKPISASVTGPNVGWAETLVGDD